MKVFNRWFKRGLIGFVGAMMVWLIVFELFDRLEDRLPWLIALLITYYLSAYLILPEVIRVTSLIIHKGKIPRFTEARDGIEVDPVNIILLGSKISLINAFEKIGWQQADKLTIKSSIKMITRFLVNKPYPKAPFSPLFLFGRKQDIGFQKPIGKSPRKRHHIRFWATNTKNIEDPLDIKFWKKKQKIEHNEALTWVGSGSEDIGFGFTKLTYQLSHKVNPNVDLERKYILKKLKDFKCIGKINYYKPGKFKVGQYVSDGRIAMARLK
jgi:hypothetical protein